MRRVDRREADALGIESEVINAYNKVHAGYRVQVEWGIGGLKKRWKIMSKRYDLSRDKFCCVFHACCVMTNFIHRRRMNIQPVVIGDNGNGEWDAGDCVVSDL